MSMIFQDPLTSLNPVFTIGNQLVEAVRTHRRVTAAAARARAVELLELVEIPSAADRLSQYPYEMSGGMRQRVMIAMALACDPDLLIADEPTTALDVTIQAQILELMRSLQRRLGTAIVIITHDLGVVADFCDRIAVMYGGRIVETGIKRDIFKRALHPYTKGLLGSVPGAGMDKSTSRLFTIPGSPPDLIAPPPGCAFAARCREALALCDNREPGLIAAGEGHEVRCWLYHGENPSRKPVAAVEAVR
jgi:oligopeptide transport system ATP-binding protein